MLTRFKKTKGSGLVEIIIAVAIFFIIAATGIATVVHTFSLNRLADEETEAALIAQEGIEAARSIRNQDWANMVAGSYGVDSSGGSWTFSGSSDTVGKFTRVVAVSEVQRDASGDIVASGGTVDPDTVRVTSTVDWEFLTGRDNSLDVVSYFTKYDDPNICGAFLDATTTTAGTNFNQSTAAALSWANAEVNSEFLSYTSASPTRLTITQTGDYLVMLTLPMQRTDGNSRRTRVQAEIRVNGTKAAVGVGRSSFIRNASSHSESSDNFHFLLSNLNANDYVEIFLTGIASTNSSDIVVVSNRATLSVEPITSSETVFAATGTTTTSGSDLNQNSATSVQWVQVRKDTGYTHSNATSPELITLDTAGNYLVFVNIPLSGSVARGNVEGTVLVGGVPVTGGSFKQGYIRNADGDTRSSIHWSGIVKTTSASQALSVQVQREASNGTITTGGENATIYVQNLGATGLYFGSGTTLTNGSEWNPASSGEVQWSSDAVIDTSYFSHSTSSNPEDITVTKDGDYLLVYNDSLTSNNGRPNPRIDVMINGNALPGAQTKTHYIRGSSNHTESSGALAYLLNNLSAGDMVSIRVSREADTDSVDDDSSALLALIEKNSCSTSQGGGTTPTVTPTSGPTATPTATATPSPTPTVTPSPTPTPTPIINTCALYCATQGYQTGTCRANSNQCNNNGETHLPAGDLFCPGGGGSDTCCCLP